MELAQEQCWLYLVCFTVYKIDSSLSSSCKAIDETLSQILGTIFQVTISWNKAWGKKELWEVYLQALSGTTEYLGYLAWDREDCKQKRQLEDNIHDVHNAQIHIFFLKRFVLHACVRQ